jgi:4-amino-4-deoxy-L-arabinose transferase-like glycosyltransferase
MADRRQPRGQARERVFLFVTLGILAAFFALSQVLSQAFSHDEHQFVAGAEMVARGLLPYRDFPFQHVPNQIYLQGVLSMVVQGKLLAARSLSGIASFGSLLLVGLILWQELDQMDQAIRSLASVLGTSLLALSHLYAFTSGRAWNHDLPVFLTLAACYLALGSKKGGGTNWGWGFTGVLVGAAAGSRMTFLLVLPAFTLAAMFWSDRRWTSMRNLVLGTLVGLGPTILLLVIDPGGFWFGNFRYAVLNESYRLLLGHYDAMSVRGKLNYFVSEVALKPLQMTLLIGWILLGIRGAVDAIRPGTFRLNRGSFVSAIAIGLSVGALAPTPTWVQYFYAPLPFVIMACMFAVAHGLSHLPGVWSRRVAIWAMALLALPMGMSVIDRGRIVNSPGAWVPRQSNLLGLEIKRHVEEGRVLTLAPTFPLEGGLEIDPRLVTGPFTWRVTPLMTPSEANQQGLLLPSELEAGRYEKDLAAILTGLQSGNDGFAAAAEGSVEDPLEAFASVRGYVPLELPGPKLPTQAKLWVKDPP